jgi:tyrosine decarboxylase/aspartate 1-decarboxylase
MGSRELRAQLDQWERASDLHRSDRNWFDEGLHLITTPALPWGDEARQIAVDSYRRFIHAEMWDTGEGGRAMEADIIAFMGGLMGASSPAGRLTVGGSESVLCGILAAKAKAFAKRFPGLGTEDRYPRPFTGGDAGPLVEFSNGRKSAILPSYAHYSSYKACALFDIEPIVVEPRPGTFYTVHPDDVRQAIREDTILIYGTAGTFPYGTVDPIAELGRIAEERDIYLHVDACFGGYIIPFLERADYYQPALEPWDFRVPGVCSISADLHKNGMAPPPVSSIIFRDASLLSDLQALAPPFGTLTGTRAVGPIAGAWTMLARLGLEGMKQVSLESIHLRDRMIDGLASIEGICITPDSRINLFCFYSDTLDLRPAVEVLRKAGWAMATKGVPAPVSVAVCTLPQNLGRVDEFVENVAAAVKEAAVPLERERAVAMEDLYGGIRA